DLARVGSGATVSIAGNVADLDSSSATVPSQVVLSNGQGLNLAGTGAAATVSGSVALLWGTSTATLTNGHLVNVSAGATANLGKNVADLQGSAGASSGRSEERRVGKERNVRGGGTTANKETATINGRIAFLAVGRLERKNL